MDKKGEQPTDCSLIHYGKVTLLIKNKFKEILLGQGILNPQSLIATSPGEGRAFKGRSILYSIPMEDNTQARMIIKPCMRGGFMRFISKDIFWRGNRPFNEMILNIEIIKRKINTTEIMAVLKQKCFWHFYRTYIISKELPQVTDVISYLQSLNHLTSGQRIKEKRKLFQSIAQEIFKLHQAGIYHHDLHLKNILITTNEKMPRIYVIDFDKATLKDKITSQEKVKNLLRLNRSIEKYKMRGGRVTRSDQMTVFKEYFKKDEESFDVFRNYRIVHACELKLRRLKWELSDAFSKLFSFRGQASPKSD